MFSVILLALVQLAHFMLPAYSYEFIVNNFTEVIKPGERATLSWSTTGTVPGDAVVSIVIRNATLRTVVERHFPDLVDAYPPPVSSKSVALNFDKYADGKGPLAYGWYRIEGAGSVGEWGWFFSLTEWFYFGPDPGQTTPLDNSRVQIKPIPNMLAPGTIALEWTHQRSAIPSSLKEETFQTSLYLYCQAGNDFNFGSVIQQTQLVYRPPNDQYYNDKWCFIDARTTYAPGVTGLNTSNWFYHGSAFANPPSPRPQDSKWVNFNLDFDETHPTDPSEKSGLKKSVESTAKKSPAVAIAGGVIGSLAVILILVGLLLYRRRRHVAWRDLAPEKGSNHLFLSRNFTPSQVSARPASTIPEPYPSPVLSAGDTSSPSFRHAPSSSGYESISASTTTNTTTRPHLSEKHSRNTSAPALPLNFANLTDEQALAREAEVLRSLNQLRAQGRDQVAPPAYDLV